MRMEVMLCPQNELLFWQRFAVKPALGVLNAMLAQPVALAFGFHPFGDGGQIERFGHFNNVRRQRPVLEGIDKRFIDFQRVDVQFLQIAQAGVAGAKVINRDTLPGLTLVSDHRHGGLRADKPALGDFKDDLFGGDPPVLQLIV